MSAADWAAGGGMPAVPNAVGALVDAPRHILVTGGIDDRAAAGAAVTPDGSWGARGASAHSRPWIDPDGGGCRPADELIQRREYAPARFILQTRSQATRRGRVWQWFGVRCR
jgi:hypothetical protein